MTSRFLITTPNEATWKTDRPVLFLGEWCRLHSRRRSWVGLDAEVVPYHWDDRRKLRDDYRYLSGLHERLLPELAATLNRIHGVDYSIRYWRILAGQWLGCFAQIVFDRWEVLRRALDDYDLSGTAVVAADEHALVPDDLAAFTDLYLDDPWNHHIFGTILRHFGRVPIELIDPPPGSSGSNKRKPSARTRIRLGLAKAYARAAGLLSRKRDAFFLATYLPVIEEMRLHAHFGQVPQLWLSVPVARTPVDPARRNWTLEGSGSEFESLLRRLIPQHLPTTYLEGYAGLMAFTERLPWPRQPRLIFTSNAHTYDEVFKGWAAARTEEGAPLVIGQHGGHYGVGEWSFLEEHDLAICDRYLSWGWTEPAQPKVQPVGQLKTRKVTGVKYTEQPRALLVTCALSRYSYWLYSSFISRQWLDYFTDQCEFVDALPQPIRDALTVRLFIRDFGWDQEARWRERFPELRLDLARGPIEEQIRQSRLYISTYNATTFLESITMDVPTIIYWNPQHWELRDSAVVEFDALERVGIFHKSPAAAARHVAAVWGDVEAWWSSPAVRAALARFQDRYCRSAPDLPKRLEQTLRDAMTPARTR